MSGYVISTRTKITVGRVTGRRSEGVKWTAKAGLTGRERKFVRLALCFSPSFFGQQISNVLALPSTFFISKGRYSGSTCLDR